MSRVGLAVGIGVGVAIAATAAGIAWSRRDGVPGSVSDEEFADLARSSGYGIRPEDARHVADASKRPLTEDYAMLRTAGRHATTTVLEIYRAGANSSLTPAQFETLVGAAEIYQRDADPALVNSFIDGSRFSLDEYASIMDTASDHSEWGGGIAQALADAEKSDLSAKAFNADIESGRYSNGAINT